MQTRPHDETPSPTAGPEDQASTASRSEWANAVPESLGVRAGRLLERAAGIASGGRQPHAIVRRLEAEAARLGLAALEELLGRAESGAADRPDRQGYHFGVRCAGVLTSTAVLAPCPAGCKRL